MFSVEGTDLQGKDAIMEILNQTDDEGLLNKYTPSHLHDLVTLSDLAYPLSRQDRLLLLNAIKVLAKHPTLNSFLYASQDFRIIASIAGLSDSQGFTENDELANEARKIIANLLLLDQNHGVHILVSEQCLPALLELSASPTTSLQSIFLIYRILFLITAVPDHISTIISFGLAHYDSLLDRVLNVTTDPLKPMALSEILKTMFNLQSRSGAEFDKPTNIFSQQVMHTVSQTLTTIRIPTPPMSSPHADAVHVLMCGLPGPWLTEQLVNVLCNEMLLPECLNNLFPITPNGHENRDKVVPLLYLLAQLYTTAGHSKLTDLIRSILVPSDLDRVRPLDQGRTLGHFVIRMLTYIESSAIRVAAETLVFSLCDKSPSKMVAHTGFGPSAGFLANHGLLNGEMLGGADIPTNSNVNPITGQSNSTQSTSDDEWSRMTDEEKEREAEQLFAKFDRLNDLGIIKVQDPRSL